MSLLGGCALVYPQGPSSALSASRRASTRDEDNFPVRLKVSQGHPSPALTEACPPKGSICASTPRRHPLLWPLSTAAPAWALLRGGWTSPYVAGAVTHLPSPASARGPLILPAGCSRWLMAPAPTTPHAAVSFLHFSPPGGPSVCVPTRVEMSFICTAQSGSHQPPRLL